MNTAFALIAALACAGCSDSAPPASHDTPSPPSPLPDPTPDAASALPSPDAGALDAPPPPAPDAAAPDASTPEPSPPWLIQSGDAVFFVGNSFMGWQNRRLPDWVAAIGKAVQPPIVIETDAQIVFGNNPLSWFFQQPASKDAIASGRYTMFVLQGEDREPVDHKADFQQAVRDYTKAIRAKGGRVMLFMTWDFSWESGSTFFAQLAASYDEIGKELHVPVIPVGWIYKDCDAQPFNGEPAYWLTAQGVHPTEAGAAADAYATFEMLTGIDPHGVEFTANGNTNSAAMLKYLSDKAWARVAPRLVP